MTSTMQPQPLIPQGLGGDDQLKKDILLVRQADHDNVFTAIDELATREAEWEPMLGALLPDANRHTRLRQEAQELCTRFPIGSDRPLLFGVLVGVKDIIHVAGMKTQAGSKLPPELLGGEEAEVVAKLREAGALILGKVQCTEFVFFIPAATQNPTAVGHTPGGSSSGSAAAVAAGLCRLALGTQTTGSISRPAAYCGVVGYKPSYGRIPLTGSLPACKPTDHMGFLASDVEILESACASCISDWKHAVERGHKIPGKKGDGVTGVLQEGDGDCEMGERSNAEGAVVGKMAVPAQCALSYRKRRLCVPLGPLMELCEADVLASFEDTLQQLSRLGWVIVHLTAFDDLDMIRESHRRLMRFEFLETHEAWIAEFGHLYNPELLSFIQSGSEVAEVEALRVRELFKELRHHIHDFMDEHDVDAWITPGATSAPPAGLGFTGNPFMPVIWSVAGLPSVTLPSAFLPMPDSMECSNSSSAGALPMAITLAGRWGEDEEILVLAKEIEKALDVPAPKRMSSCLRKLAT